MLYTPYMKIILDGIERAPKPAHLTYRQRRIILDGIERGMKAYRQVNPDGKDNP